MPEDETEPEKTLIPEESDDTIESDIHDFRELLRTEDLEGLLSALDNPDLFRMACDDERYMRIVMQGIGVLAWDEPARASEFLVRFDAEQARKDDPDSDARRAGREILAALEWRQLEAQNLLPVASMDKLRNFLRLYPALGEVGSHGTQLRDDLKERPAFYADFFQKLARSAQILPGWIIHIDREENGESEEAAESGKDNALEELSEAQLSALSSAVSDLRASLKSRFSQYAMWIVVVGVVVALPNAVGALIALVVIGGYMGFGESRSYETIVRPRLVTLAIEHGVGARHVVSWLYRLSRKAGRVGSFDIKIENDLALDLLAALARTSTPSSEPAQ
jgi:hypothetical protein